MNKWLIKEALLIALHCSGRLVCMALQCEFLTHQWKISGILVLRNASLTLPVLDQHCLLTRPCVLFFLRSSMEPNFIAEFWIFLLKVFSKAFRERCQAFLIRAWLQNGSTLSNSVSHFLPASKSLRSDHPVEVYRLSLDFKVVWKSLKLLISNQRFCWKSIGFR